MIRYAIAAELKEVTAERDRLQSDLDMAEWDGPL